MEHMNMQFKQYPVCFPLRFERIGSGKDIRIHADRIMASWVLGIITTGTMHAAIGNDRASITTGQYYLMPPNIRHFGTCVGVHDVIWFTFSDSADRKQPNTPQGCGIALPPFGRMPPNIDYPALHALISESLELGYMHPQQISTQIMAIVGQMHAYHVRILRTENDPGSLLAEDILAFLRANHLQKFCAKDLSAALHYSYGHLNRVFKNRFNVSIQQRFTEMKIEAAFNLLLQGRSIKETAAQVGFDDYYYFLKTFKKVKKNTPTRALEQAGVRNRKA